MSNVSIHYSLSEAGRKASLLAGGNGQSKQTMAVGRDDPLFARALALATVSNQGEAMIVVHGLEHDAIPSVESVLATLETKVEEKKKAEAARIEKKREDTLAVLRERRTVRSQSATVFDDCGVATYTYDLPAWPYLYDRDEKVIESPEAATWLAELEAAKLEALGAAKEAARADRLAKEEAKAKAAAAEAAWRAKHGLAEGDKAYRIEDGALADVPVWETHSRGKNWLAKIDSDPAMPGGLVRDFAVKAKGDLFYVLPELTPGDAVEFAADYVSGGGLKNRLRWHGVYLRTIPASGDSPSYVVLHQESSGAAAIKAGRKIASQAATA